MDEERPNDLIFSKATDNHSTASHGSSAPPPTTLQTAFPMVQGDGEDSYSRNSEYQAFITRAAPLLALDEALQRVTLPSPGKPVVVVDLGSSSGPNTIFQVAHIVDNLRRRLPADAEFQACFNDIASNDFNNLFQLLSNDARAKNFYAAGVAGSFYGRLLPRSAVHIFHSANSLHWLSKIPDAVVEKGSPAYNEGQVWHQHSRSAVAKAYQQQALLDLKSFLLSRAAELVPGGLLFVVFGGRESSEPHDYDGNGMDNFLSVLNEIFSGLVAEGLVTKQQHDALNIPLYHRNLDDIRDALASCGPKFEVVIMKMHTVDFTEAFQAAGPDLPKKIMGTFKAAYNPQLESHVGQNVADVVWQRFEKLVEKAGFRPEFYRIGIVGLVRN